MSFNFFEKNNIAKNIGFIIFFWALIRVVVYIIIDFSNIYGGDSGYYISSGIDIIDRITSLNSSELIVQSTYRPPLYSVFTGLLVSISDDPLFIFVSHSIIYLLFSIFCYILLRKKNEKLALFSAIVIAFSPSDAMYNSSILSENIATPLLVSSSLLFALSKNYKSYFISGTIVGLAVLVRDIYILLPFLFALTGLLYKKPVKYLVIYLCGFMMIVTPWIIRNINLEHNSGMYISKGIMWPNIWAGTWIRDYRDTIDASINKVPEKALNTFSPHISKNDFFEIWNDRVNNENIFKDVTVNYFSNNPLKVLEAWVSRYHLLWLGTRSDLLFFNYKRYSNTWYVIKSSLYLINTLIILFSVLGMYLTIISKHKTLLLLMPVIFYNALIYIPLYNIETRYTQPVYPILLMFAVFFILNVKKYYKKSKTAKYEI
ncbi:hypothetical protein HN615_16380 [Candidatus Woesearchaeota archaeon]|jgi:hypothetical protein|nr:hypothetical protein [bacterium]MBT7558480.1 hypothetical protein [Candidatus Woesearchaeota archaeon]